MALTLVAASPYTSTSQAKSLHEQKTGKVNLVSSSWGDPIRIGFQQQRNSWQIRKKSARTGSAQCVQQNASVRQKYYVGQDHLRGNASQPPWAGDSFLAKVVTAALSNKSLLRILHTLARTIIIRGGEARGVMWRKMAEELRETPQVYEEKEALENKTLVYPEYYLRKFHAYDQGNLCWEAAFEVEAATLSMACRCMTDISDPQECLKAVRQGWVEQIREHHAQHSRGLPVSSVLDVGCAAGNSTACLADAFPSAQVIGLDLSPYFLAVASFREKEREKRSGALSHRRPIQWMHAKGEETGLPDQSMDIISLSFVIHECPVAATRALVREAKRVLRRGGTFSIKDNSPQSKVIQSLPPPVFAAMKSTEPYSDEYFSADIEAIIMEEGFDNVETSFTDPRHRTITATAM